MLDRLDIEAETRERFGEQLEILVLDRRIGLCVFVDLLLAQRQQLFGTVEAQHLERAGDLPAVVGKSGELVALRMIAEKSVEHLFDMTQVGLDFARDLRQQQTLLCAAGHFVE